MQYDVNRFLRTRPANCAVEGSELTVLAEFEQLLPAHCEPDDSIDLWPVVVYVNSVGCPCAWINVEQGVAYL